MSLFMDVLSLVFQLSVQQKIDYIISKFQLNNNSSLPNNYYELIFDKDNRSLQLFKQLIRRVKYIKSASGLIKIFTIILKVLRVHQYNSKILDILQEIEVPQIYEIQNHDGEWIKQIAISLKSYLKRIPSCGDILKRVMIAKHQKNNIENMYMVSDLYRLLNTTNLLFPGLTVGINVVGRYYKEKLHYFSHFFNAIKEEIMQGYGYIDSILVIVRNNYKKLDEKSLYCIIDSLPVIELYCDKTQQLFFNKYYKSKGLSKKISFRQEQIQKILYYLQNEEKRRSKKAELANTSDSQKIQSIYE